jgi:hypothetical protein
VPPAEAAAVLQRLQRELAQCLGGFGQLLPFQVWRYLAVTLHTHTRLPAFYVLPKIHKLPRVSHALLPLLKGRPIVASHSWVTTPASQWLAEVLNTACAAAYPHVLPDSRALIRDLESMAVAREALLVTFDVESMYPSVDIPLAIAACTAAVQPSLRPVVDALLRFVMGGNFFQFAGTTYQQIQGGAMGTPCMPPVANIFMAHCVEAPLRARAAYWPRAYRRLIDDGFFVWERDRASLEAFLADLNSALPGIRITWQISSTSIACLDLVITKDQSKVGPTVPLVISTFQKPHNRYLYIPRSSFHRPHTFAGFVRGELIRYAVTNTHAAGFQRMRRLFMQRLLARGYSKAWLREVFATVSHASRGAHLAAPRRRARAAAQSQPPVFVASNGPLEMQARLSAVINSVYAQHAQQGEVRAALAGANRITVAYHANPSIGALLVRAQL